MSNFPTPVPLSEILAIKKSQKYPIWGPITRKSITLLFGSTGVGKSFFIWSLLYAIASLEKFCGYLPSGIHRSLVVDGEMDREDAAHRLGMIRAESEMHIGCDSINLLTREDFNTGLVPNISLPKCQLMYSEIMQPFDVVVIDNLNTTSYPRNDRDGEISQFLRVLPWLLKLRDSGKAVILVHHTNKAGQQMGSILKEQIASNVLELGKVKGGENLKFKMIWHKHRHVSKADAKAVIVEAIPSPEGLTWITEDPEGQLEDRIMTLKSEGLKQKEIAEQLNIELWDVMKVVKKNQGGADVF